MCIRDSSISGQVTDASNHPIPDVIISAAGPTNKTTTTDINGNYSLSGLANGTYTITPSKDGYTFNPSVLPFTGPPSAINKDFVGYDRPPIVFVHGWQS